MKSFRSSAVKAMQVGYPHSLQFDLGKSFKTSITLGTAFGPSKRGEIWSRRFKVLLTVAIMLSVNSFASSVSEIVAIAISFDLKA